MNARWFGIGAAVAAAAAVTVVACGGGNGTRLSVSTRAGSAASASPTALASASRAASMPAGIVLSQVTMVVRTLQLEGAPACPTSGAGSTTGSGTEGSDDQQGSTGTAGQMTGDDQGETDDCELRFGPLPVVVGAAALAAGSVTSQFDVTVPSGDYEELEIVIAPISAAEAGTDTILLAMAAAPASMKIDGTIDGAAFSFTTVAAFSQKREPFSIPATGGNVTLSFDPTTWFVDASGNRLDPTVAANATTIEQNIRASLRMLDDDDRDGVDDSTDQTGMNAG